MLWLMYFCETSDEGRGADERSIIYHIPGALYHHLLKLKKEYRLVVHQGRHIVVAAQAQNLFAQSLRVIQEDGIMTHIPQPPLQILPLFACDRAKRIHPIC
jgi:hypothetical protein